MNIHTLGASILLVVSSAGAAGAATRHWEGAVTSYDSGRNQVVVCTFESPYTCNMVRVYGGTVMSASQGASPHLSRGEYVSVDASVSGAQTVATRITIYGDRIVRSIRGFQGSQAQRLATTLFRLPGVTGARINPNLGEVLITFNNRVTSPRSIERSAAQRGVHLALPG